MGLLGTLSVNIVAKTDKFGPNVNKAIKDVGRLSAAADKVTRVLNIATRALAGLAALKSVAMLSNRLEDLAGSSERLNAQFSPEQIRNIKNYSKAMDGLRGTIGSIRDGTIAKGAGPGTHLVNSFNDALVIASGKGRISKHRQGEEEFNRNPIWNATKGTFTGAKNLFFGPKAAPGDALEPGRADEQMKRAQRDYAFNLGTSLARGFLRETGLDKAATAAGRMGVKGAKGIDGLVNAFEANVASPQAKFNAFLFGQSLHGKKAPEVRNALRLDQIRQNVLDAGEQQTKRRNSVNVALREGTHAAALAASRGNPEMKLQEQQLEEQKMMRQALEDINARGEAGTITLFQMEGIA